MSILIKGLDMPKDCPMCLLAYWNASGEFCGCSLIKRYYDYDEMQTSTRPDFCPLVEIPTPHGRLIDFTKLEFEDVAFDKVTINAPTVIESED